LNLQQQVKGLLFTLIILSTLVPSSILAQESTLPKAPYITPQEVKQWQSEGKEFTLIDVRRPDEFEAGHLPDAINIPYDELQNKIAEVPKDRPVIFYCTYSSWRAPYAANLLADSGFHDSYVLEGGASAWNAGGQIIFSSDPNQKPQIVPKPADLVANFEHPPIREYLVKINLTKEQLREFNGKDGRPAYIAVDGTIYDVTQSRLWRGGEHDPSHHEAFAGRDLSDLIHESPHGDKHLKYFPVVGRLIEEEPIGMK